MWAKDLVHVRYSNMEPRGGPVKTTGSKKGVLEGSNFF